MSWGSPGFGGSAAGGLVFAKRKKNVFKGPMLNTSSPRGGDGTNAASGGRGGSHSRSTSIAGRPSGEIIAEEDEDEIEEVEAFSPLSGPGEVEMIFPPSEAQLEVIMPEKKEKEKQGGPGEAMEEEKEIGTRKQKDS